MYDIYLTFINLLKNYLTKYFYFFINLLIIFLKYYWTFFTYVADRLSYLFNIYLTILINFSPQHTGTHSICFNLFFADISMMKMISTSNKKINVQSGDLKMLVLLIAGIATSSILFQYLDIEINVKNLLFCSTYP